MTSTPNPTKVLRRCPHHRMFGGVAAGIADYTGMDLTAVRIAIVVLAVATGVVVPLYLAAWLLVPEEGSDVSIAQDLSARYTGDL